MPIGTMRILDYYNPDDSDLCIPDASPALVRHVVVNRLNRVLAFTGLTIDDVVNNPVAKNQVRGYFKLAKLIDRRSEIVDLERQWNPRG
jgi:hypothetical protein